MDVDLLAGLGVGFLGSRLKRLAERLQLAQPTVTRALGPLERDGFIETRRTPGDQRSKRLVFTDKGRALMARIQTELLPRIEPAAAELVAGLAGDFMLGLSQAEARLAERSLLTRAQMAGRPMIWARDFSDDLAEAFYRINAEWIQEMFALEDNDIALLSKPRDLILDRGGVVLFAETADLGVVGTCALMVSKDGWVELTKMGVLKSARGLKAGEFLLAKTLERAASLGMDRIYLLTNRKCAAAIHLYEKLGFVHDEEIMRKFGARYQRCDVAMSYRPQ